MKSFDQLDYWLHQLVRHEFMSLRLCTWIFNELICIKILEYINGFTKIHNPGQGPTSFSLGIFLAVLKHRRMGSQCPQVNAHQIHSPKARQHISSRHSIQGQLIWYYLYDDGVSGRTLSISKGPQHDDYCCWWDSVWRFRWRSINKDNLSGWYNA